MTQSEQILEHIKKYGSITALEAVLDYRIMRLSAVIYNLRQLGIDIETVPKQGKNGKHYAEYRMAEM